MQLCLGQIPLDWRVYLNHVFSAYIWQVDFHDLDFVEAPGALGPSKNGNGVERLDFVGQKVPCSNAMFLVFGVFQTCVYKNLKPQPHQVNFWWY